MPNWFPFLPCHNTIVFYCCMCAFRHRPPVSEEEGGSECSRERRVSATILWIRIWHAVAAAAGVRRYVILIYHKTWKRFNRSINTLNTALNQILAGKQTSYRFTAHIYLNSLLIAPNNCDLLEQRFDQRSKRVKGELMSGPTSCLILHLFKRFQSARFTICYWFHIKSYWQASYENMICFVMYL